MKLNSESIATADHSQAWNTDYVLIKVTHNQAVREQTLAATVTPSDEQKQVADRITQWQS